ncbi:MAG: hypothetical protein OEY86_07110 [Nitrospira sp.]|nr:hypothetical protein [Nitrospira sp.]
MDLLDAPIIRSSVAWNGERAGSVQTPLHPLQSHGSLWFHTRIAATVSRTFCIGAQIVADFVAIVAAGSLQQLLQPLHAIRKCARHQGKLLQRWIVAVKVLFPGGYKYIPRVATVLRKALRIGHVSSLRQPDVGCGCRSRA